MINEAAARGRVRSDFFLRNDLGSVSGVRLERSSFFEIPDLETLDVHPKGPFAKAQRDSFHQQLVLGEDCVAGVARFAVAWSTPDRSDAVMRQATALELATDEEVESFLVDSGLAGQPHTRQPDSPGSRRRSVNP